MEDLLDTEQARAARRLTEQAGTILLGLRGDLPESFAAQLFARAAPEDLLRYEPREIAALAEDAWQFLKERAPGTAKVRLRSPSGAAGAERVKTVSIVEIVNDNMPFLLDSILGELNEQGLEVRLVAHPVFAIERDTAGNLLGFHGEAASGGTVQRESFIHIHTDRVGDETRRAEIVQALEQVLADVRLCVADWRAMVARVGDVIAQIRSNPPQLPVDEVAEAVQFLEWMTANNFTFLGVREYAFPREGGEVEPKFETGLGILRARDVRILRRGREFVTITPEIREFLKEPKALIITKANVRSRVHRRVHMDYIGVKRFDREGRVAGEFRIVGLFTSTVYTRPPKTIPYLRRKVDAVITRTGFDPGGHSGKALVNVLDGYPRDELFQIDEDTLFRFAMEILYLDERPRVRVLARRDRFDRFVSVLVYVPRERYDSGTRKEIAASGGVGLDPMDYQLDALSAELKRSGGGDEFDRLADAAALKLALSVLPRGAVGARAFHRRALRGADARCGSRDDRASGRRDRADLDRRAHRGDRPRPRSGEGASSADALPRRFPAGLSRGLRRRRGDRRYPHAREPVVGWSARGRVPPPARRRRRFGRLQGLEPRAANPAFGARAGPREHGIQGRRRAHLPGRA